ncbi:MAG: FtsX-like permease family protein [Acidobacteria bacterium]|nr:FtsX-like permease family protein [Acidobacteriota bacterium]
MSLAPRAATLLLKLILRGSVGAAVLSDLGEEFTARAERDGLRQAKRWYWRQARWSLGPALRLGRSGREGTHSTGGTLRPGGRGPGARHAIGLGAAIGSLRGHRAAALTVVVTLGLGIAAGTAVFSILSRVIMEPLPYAQPDRLALVRVDRPTTPNHPLMTGAEYVAVTGIPAIELASSVAADMNLSWEAPDGPKSIEAAGIGVDMLRLLGVQPALGRDFREEDRDGGPSAVIATWRFWRDELAGNAEAIGQSLTLAGRAYTLVGVLPEHFELFVGRDARGAEDAAVFFPSRVAVENTRFATFRALVRLAPETSHLEAEQQLALLPARLAELDPEMLGGEVTYRLVPLHQDEIADARSAIVGLLAAGALVVLLTCLNSAGLLLAQGARRAPEYAVRAALGASRARLLSQSLIETAILTAGATAVGITLGVVFLHQLLARVPIQIPRMDAVSLDPRAIWLATALAALVAGAAGLLPALQAGGADPQAALRAAGSRVVSSSRSRYGLVIAQIAVSVVLLLGSGLMVRTLHNLRSVPLGYATENLYTAKVIAPRPAEGDTYWQFFQRALESLEETPGVAGATAVSRTPLLEQSDVEIVNFGLRPDDLAAERADLRWILPNTFDVLGTPILEGRSFTWQEVRDQSPVVVVGHQMATRLWPDRSPIGQEVWIPRRWGGEPEAARVVGVVAHARIASPREIGRSQAFRPASHMNWGVMTLAARSQLPPSEVFGRIREVAARSNARNVYSLAPMATIVAETMAATTVAAVTVAGLGLTAGLATLIGLYGLLSFLITSERREIGLRLALGARPAEMAWRYVGRGLMLAAVGLGFGAIVGTFLGGLVEASLFGITAHDPLTWLVVCTGLLGVAALAVLKPALTASSIEPVDALRSE